MAQWDHMTRILQCLSHDTVNSLYHPTTFPIEMRHYIAAWIENQRWEDFTMENLELESQAQTLLDETISMLELVADQTDNVVDKMKLIQSSRNMGLFQTQPLQFAVMVRDTLRKEKAVINESNCPPFQTGRDTNTQDVDHLVLKVREVQNIRKEMHLVQQDLNWLRQNYENLQGSFQQNGLDASNTEIQRLQNSRTELQKQIQNLETKLNTLAMQRFHLLKECVDSLERSQTRLISSLKTWRWEQHKSTIGLPFDENLSPLQMWCEQLLGMNGNLRQELLLIGEQISDLQERLKHLLQTLIESSFVVDKQPPQVIKTQSKFTTTVRYLLGEKVAPGKPVMLTAQIINELQAKNLANLTSRENVAELINNTAILEHNAASKSTCATFRSLSIKKIKRADRKGTESVTEEKFALLFSAEITITGCDTPYKIQMISQPLVIIVHGCQDNNALATIIWDAAFSEPDRVPFVVPERVPWRMMCNTLNSKFTSEVQTQHNLDQYNQHFLAQKIFNKPDFTEDFSNMMVSWSQFNKEVLPGRTFTFWQWFEGVIDLTKKNLQTYWSENLIFGFIGKQHLHLVLKDKPNGTFMLRFSDSEIGGITIAYVSATENGGQKIKNIQPFTKKDLDIRSLGDRIHDITEITYLYPSYPKHKVFKKFFSEPQALSVGGYIPVSLHAKVGMDATPAAPSVPSVPESSHDVYSMDIPQSSGVPTLTESPHSNFFVDSPVAASAMGPLDNTHTDFSVHLFQQSFSPEDLPEDILKNTNSSPDYGEQISTDTLGMDIDTFLGILP